MIFGFNTKALKVSDRLLALLSRNDVVVDSYMSLSIDAGSNAVYNSVHDVKTNTKLYDRVLNNVRKICQARVDGGGKIDISAAYLVNIHNHKPEEVTRFIVDYQDAGCDILRFTFPQPPRGIITEPGVVPSKEDCILYKAQLAPLVKAASTKDCEVLFVDADSEHDIFHRPRTNPCFARFVFPTVGYDGWLYHCSQSSSPNFRTMALGNLNTDDFWDVFYNYDLSDQNAYFSGCAHKMEAAECRCDRKMHVLNQGVTKSGIFDSPD